MAFRIHKILNNNAVVVLDEGKEKIVMGPGIAFQKRKNDLIPVGRIEKIFVMEEENEKFQQLLRTLQRSISILPKKLLAMRKGSCKRPLATISISR